MPGRSHWERRLLAVLAAPLLAVSMATAQDPAGDSPDYSELPKGASLKSVEFNSSEAPFKLSASPLLLPSSVIGGGSSSVIGGGATKISGGVSNLSTDLSTLANSASGIKIDESETELKISLAGDVLFDFDKAKIRADAEASLTKLAEILSKHSRNSVTVIGFTDSKGKDEYNQKLSERRARSVAAWLKERGGLSSWSFTVAGRGERDPVAPNTLRNGKDDPDGRQKNRRVEITVKKS